MLLKYVHFVKIVYTCTTPTPTPTQEVKNLREVLTEKLADVSTSLTGDFPAVSDNLWLGADESQAVASALVPKLEKTKQEIGQLLFEVVQLEVRVCVREGLLGVGVEGLCRVFVGVGCIVYCRRSVYCGCKV